MSLFIAILIGVMAGSSTAYFLFRDFDLILVSSLCGIAGAIAGLVFYYFVIAQASIADLSSMGGAFASLCGALFFALVFNGLHRLAPKPAPPRLESEPDDDA